MKLYTIRVDDERKFIHILVNELGNIFMYTPFGRIDLYFDLACNPLYRPDKERQYAAQVLRLARNENRKITRN